MNSDNNILVKLNNAGFRQNDKWLVEGVSLKVEKGKIVTLIGPNGSGKSTTAKIALGIYKNIEGSVEKYTNKVGYVPQKISIDWTLPLRVNDFMTLTENIKDDEINKALSLTGVMHLKNKNLGITEFLALKNKVYKSEVMIIYNKKLSVSPITTHLPLKSVTKMINKKIIIQKVKFVSCVIDCTWLRSIWGFIVLTILRLQTEYNIILNLYM